MQVTINDDQTVTIVGCDNSLDGVSSHGLDTQVNALGLVELFAVRLAVRNNPFPLGKGEQFYRECLKHVEKNVGAISPEVSLGKLRCLMVREAAGGCNAPTDSYLRIAYDIKTNQNIINSY